MDSQSYGCARPRAGCPCAPGREPVECEVKTRAEGQDQVLCESGVRYCVGGIWSECTSFRTYVLPRPTTLVIDPDDDVSQCSACEVNCLEVSDPLDPDDPLPDDGCVEYDDGGGITLVEDETCDPDDTGGAGAGGSGGTGGSGGSSDECVVQTCQGRFTYDCGDCVDNDGDGLTDDEDPECLGSCDNNEEGLFGNIPGQNVASCMQDCYFDKDTGHGNDDCRWDSRCDPLEPEASCEYDENTNVRGTRDSCADLRESQSSTCEDECIPLTPDGCDCWGCCELPAGSGDYIWIDDSDCTMAGALAGDGSCPECTPNFSCFNPCESSSPSCEVCFGQTEDDLPAECQIQYAVEGVYEQDVSSDCSGTTERPDWTTLDFDAVTPDGTQIEFAVCTGEDTTELDSCTSVVVATVTGSGSCADDSDCSDATCVSGVCQQVVGASCSSDDDCTLDATCSSGSCLYASGPPVDIAAVLPSGDNNKALARVTITLRASTDQTEAPTVTSWSLRYSCDAVL